MKDIIENGIAVGAVLEESDNPKVFAPFSVKQVAALNKWQNLGYVHPFTCGGDRGDAAHKEYQFRNGGDFGQLIATESGWICPVCGDTQNWAHGFMADESRWPARLSFLQNPWRRQLRRYQSTDLHDILELIAIEISPTDADIAAGNLATPSEHEERLVAECDGRLIGTCGFWRDPHLPPHHCGMYWFAVRKEYQKRGVGSALLRETELLAAAAGYRTIFAESHPQSVEFYQKHGYVKSSDANLEACLDRFPDTVLMTKKL